MRKARRKTQTHRGELSRRTCLQAGVTGGIGLAGLSRLGAGTPAATARDSKPKAGGTLVVRSGPMRGIDPHFETWGTTLQVVHQTYNGLVKFGVQPWVRNYTVPINAYDQRSEAIWVDRERS